MHCRVLLSAATVAVAAATMTNANYRVVAFLFLWSFISPSGTRFILAVGLSPFRTDTRWCAFY